MSDFDNHLDPDADLSDRGTGRALVPTKPGFSRNGEPRAQGGKIVGWIAKIAGGDKSDEVPDDSGDETARRGRKAYEEGQDIVDSADSAANGKGDDGVDVTA